MVGEVIADFLERLVDDLVLVLLDFIGRLIDVVYGEPKGLARKTSRWDCYPNQAGRDTESVGEARVDRVRNHIINIRTNHSLRIIGARSPEAELA